MYCSLQIQPNRTTALICLSKTGMLRTYSSNPISTPKIHISKHFIGFQSYHLNMKNVVKTSVTNLCVVCTLLRIITINSSYKHVHGLWYNLQENLTIYKVYKYTYKLSRTKFSYKIQKKKLFKMIQKLYINIKFLTFLSNSKVYTADSILRIQLNIQKGHMVFKYSILHKFQGETNKKKAKPWKRKIYRIVQI